MEIKSRMQPEVWSSSMNLFCGAYLAMQYVTGYVKQKSLKIIHCLSSFGMKWINAIKIAP